MTTRLLYFGPQWPGSTSLQRLHAFQQLDGISAVGINNGSEVGQPSSLWRRVRWKLRLPVDALAENQRLMDGVAEHRPDIVVVDNSKVISRKALRTIRGMGVGRLVYYSPDDIVAPHNLSMPLKWSLPDWDIVCTTKTFNVSELLALGVKRPLLIGKAFDPELHRPMPREAMGAEFESFDAVFIGTYERERCASINALAESGSSVVVYGADKGKWQGKSLHPGITLRNSVFDEDYVRSWHVGKVALCFLRKANRDRITQRTMEIAAVGRPMVAERTDEHDQHFECGRDYLGFRDDHELSSCVKSLVGNDEARIALGAAARRRCLVGGYSSVDRAREMIRAFSQ